MELPIFKLRIKKHESLWEKIMNFECEKLVYKYVKAQQLASHYRSTSQSAQGDLRQLRLRSGNKRHLNEWMNESISERKEGRTKRSNESTGEAAVTISSWSHSEQSFGVTEDSFSKTGKLTEATDNNSSTSAVLSWRTYPEMDTVVRFFISEIFSAVSSIFGGLSTVHVWRD